MKKKVTAIAAFCTAVAVNAFANNVDSKDCKYLDGKITVQLGDVVVKQGEIARPMYNFVISARATDGYYDGIQVAFVNDYCIDGMCHHDVWPTHPVHPIYGLKISNTGTLDLGKVMLNKGTYNTTFRIYSRTMQCDATAVGTIYVQ